MTYDPPQKPEDFRPEEQDPLYPADEGDETYNETVSDDNDDINSIPRGSTDE